jgi:hypothetical protein
MGLNSEVFSNLAVTDTAVLVKAGAVALSGYHVFNTVAAATYLMFYDAAAAADVTLGTTVPKFCLGLPTSGGATRSLAKPIQFTLGIVIGSLDATTGHGAAISVVELEITKS